MTKTTVHIRKENIKFSVAHMTVFPDGSKEALHGHNYQMELSLELKDSSFKKMISFSAFKEVLKKMAAQLDEKVLLAEKNPFFKKTKKDKNELEFVLCKKRYVLPLDEVELLPLDNISSEGLSEYLLKSFIKNYGEKELGRAVKSLKIRVDESPGQGASAEKMFE